MSFAASLITLSFSSAELLAQGNSGGNNGNGQGGGGPQLWSLSGNPTSSGDFLGTSNAMPIIFKTDDTEWMRLLPDGRFGVGTSTPQYLLDVDGSFRALDTSFLNSTFIQGPFYLQDGSQASGRVLTSDANGQGVWTAKDSVNFWSRSGSDLYYDGGRVGIGTASPMQRLDVNGNALVRQQLFVQKGVEIGGMLRSDSSRFGNIGPQPGDSAIRVSAETHMMNEACVMNGNFGIGTGSPGSRLTVMGDARIHGTTTTDSLRVNGTTEFGFAQFDSVRIGASSINIGTSSSGFGGAPANTIETDGDDDLFIQTEVLSNHHTGNVGIGSGDPQKKLHVKAVHIAGQGGVQTGDHAGIRLENLTESAGGQVVSSEWDLTPVVTGAPLPGGSGGEELWITPTSLSPPHRPLLNLTGDQEVRIEHGSLGVGVGSSGLSDSKVRVSGEPSGDQVLINGDPGRSLLGLRGSHEKKLTMENGGAANTDPAFSFFVKNSLWGLDNVLQLMGGGAPTPDAIVLSMFNEKEKSIVLKGNGQVGVGTPEVQSGHKLTVNGSILAREIVVEDGWPDWVFLPDYDLPTLEEERAHIEEHGHLKDVPSEAEVLEEGLALGNLTKVQQQKVEELYLHLFELKETIEAQAEALETNEKELEQREKEIELLRERNEILKEELELLKKMMEERFEKDG